MASRCGARGGKAHMQTPNRGSGCNSDLKKNDKSLVTVVVCSRKKTGQAAPGGGFQRSADLRGSGGVYVGDVPSRRRLQARSRTGWSACVSQLTWEAFGVPQGLLLPPQARPGLARLEDQEEISKLALIPGGREGLFKSSLITHQKRQTAY